jgi:oxygen-independent coproporphyrinogen-3 oxidase
LPATTVARLIGLVRDRFGLSLAAEVTLEANPGPDERGDAVALAEAGVTRLSLGAQSMSNVELRAIGRRHSPADVTDAVASARASGIASISLDLLYDLPGQTLDSWATTLDLALALEPDHLSLYGLTLDDPDAEGLTGPAGDHLPVRPGARRWRDRARIRQDDDSAAAMYELADARLAEAGFAWYEISNWARPGHRGRHNLAYWQRLSYVALGPGAHAFDGVTRRWTAARLDRYFDALVPSDGSPPTLPPGGSERIEGRLAVAESAILRLRTADGLSAEAARRPSIRGPIERALADGLVAEGSRGHVVLTLRGRLLSNEVYAGLL